MEKQPLTESEALTALDAKMDERDRLFDEASKTSPYATPLGATATAYDPSMYSGDYRERLDPSDPVRLKAEADGSMRSHGSPAAVAAMRAAHRAGLKAARSRHNR